MFLIIFNNFRYNIFGIVLPINLESFKVILFNTTSCIKGVYLVFIKFLSIFVKTLFFKNLSLIVFVYYMLFKTKKVNDTKTDSGRKGLKKNVPDKKNLEVEESFEDEDEDIEEIDDFADWVEKELDKENEREWRAHWERESDRLWKEYIQDNLWKRVEDPALDAEERKIEEEEQKKLELEKKIELDNKQKVEKGVSGKKKGRLSVGKGLPTKKGQFNDKDSR